MQSNSLHYINPTSNIKQLQGNNHLLEIRLLETGFLSRFQPNP
jgi:hypothetical protein